MRVSSIVTVLAGTVAGLGVAVVAYQSSSALPESASGGSPTSVNAPAADPTPVKARLAPCTPPAELVRGACVTEVERTVVVYDAPVGSGAQPAARPSYPATASGSRDDDGAASDDDAAEDAYEELEDDEYDDHESEDDDDTDDTEDHEDHEDDGSEAPEPEDD